MHPVDNGGSAAFGPNVQHMGAQPWRLPGYRVERLIGSGAFGEVWQARVRSTGVAVALKRIPLRDPTQRGAALAEAAVLSALDHPNLVRLHQLVHVDGAIVLVLDLAAAGSLASLLSARGRLTPGEAISVLAPIAAALAHAHSAGVVHGDVTPANVVFTEIGLPLLADLGVARLLGDQAPAHTTPAYADPSVIAGYLPGPASDVFMLGAVAVHTLSGSWAGTSPSDDIAAAEWLADIERNLAAAGVPSEMADIVTRALAFEPERRGTAADFALELRHSGQPVAVELSAGRSRVEPSLARLAAIAAGPERSAGTGNSSAPVSGAPPLTRGVRPPSPLVPRPARHRARARSLMRPIAVLIAVLALLAAGLLWWPDLGTRPQQRAQPVPGHTSMATLKTPAPAAPVTSSGTVTSRPSGTATSPPSGTATSQRSRRSGAAPPASPEASAARRVLAELDAARASAFAARDTDLLRGVYASPSLLARDAALLTSIVPPGCGLRGVRTSYAHVQITGRDGAALLVRVDATLAPSTLVCAGTASGVAPGTGPATLRIELTPRSGGYLIAAQVRLG